MTNNKAKVNQETLAWYKFGGWFGEVEDIDPFQNLKDACLDFRRAGVNQEDFIKKIFPKQKDYSLYNESINKNKTEKIINEVYCPITDESLENKRSLEEVEEEGRKLLEDIEKGWFPFEHFDFKFYPRSFTLLCCSSGQGKTSLVAKATMKSLEEGKRVLILLNEESVENFCLGLSKYGDYRIFWNEQLFVYDNLTTDNLTENADYVVPIMKKFCQKYQPDLIILDQIGYCNKGKGKTIKEKIDYIADQIRELIHCKDLEKVPSIMVTQQGKNSFNNKGESQQLKTSYMDLIRDSTQTYQRCTHFIHYEFQKDTKVGFLCLHKVRSCHYGRTMVEKVLYKNERLLVVNSSSFLSGMKFE